MNRGRTFPSSFGLLNVRAIPAALPEPGGRAHRVLGFSLLGWVGPAILGWLLMGFVVSNFVLPRALPGGWNIYLVQPIVWGYLGFLAYLGWKHVAVGKPRIEGRVLFIAGVTGIFQVALIFLAGVFYGFGHSPYSHRLSILAGNFMYFISILIGFEISRAYLVCSLKRRSPTLALLVSALLFTLLGLPVARLSTINGPAAFFRVSGESLLPAFSENVLASFLAFIGGPLPAILYRGALMAAEWTSPILPDLPWTITAFLETVAPAFGIIVVWNHYIADDAGDVSDVEAPQRRASNTWVFVGVITVTLVWFSAGLFGVTPTLVAGHSMEPALVTGDVAVTREVPVRSIKVGDIIQFQQGNDSVLHRVLSIERNEAGVWFITKGDANHADDPPVSGREVRGVLVLRIPKVGWLGILPRLALEWMR